MTSFDPAAAAAAYVQRLPGDALAAAPDQTAWNEILLVASVAVALLAAFTVVRLGVLERIRDGLEGADRPAWMTDAACAGAATGLIGIALALLAPISAAHTAAVGGVLPALIMALRQPAHQGIERRGEERAGCRGSGRLCSGAWPPYWCSPPSGCRSPRPPAQPSCRRRLPDPPAPA